MLDGNEIERTMSERASSPAERIGSIVSSFPVSIGTWVAAATVGDGRPGVSVGVGDGSGLGDGDCVAVGIAGAKTGGEGVAVSVGVG